MSIQYLVNIWIPDGEEDIRPRVRLRRLDKPEKEYPDFPAALGFDTTLNINQTEITLGALTTEITEPTGDLARKLLTERGQLEIGSHLFKQLFDELDEEEYNELCAASASVDLRIVTKDEKLSRLPWMLLHNGNELVATRNWSISLSLPEIDWVTVELRPSPRIMIVMPEPGGNYDPTGAENHFNKLEKMLSDVNRLHKRDKSICLVKTWREFKDNINRVKPEILYYYGHGEYNDGNTQLVFSPHQKVSSAEFANALNALGADAPVLVYVNCCLGDAGGILGIGIQLRNITAAVITNCSKVYVDIAQTQGLDIWKNILVKGLPPHEAVAEMRKKFGSEPGELSSTDWITPVVYCRYNQWNFKPKPLTENFDLNWRNMLDRISQAGAINMLTKAMLQQNRQKAVTCLWYGKKGHGVEQFTERVKIELMNDYRLNTRIYDVRPDWADQFAYFREAVSGMFMQAFDVDDFEKVGETIRVEVNRMRVGAHQVIIYIPHPALTKEKYFYKAAELKDYLEWLDSEFVPLLPNNVFALIGLPYIVEKPPEFKSYIEEKIEFIKFSNMSVYILDELGKIRRSDLFKFLQAREISIPDDKLDLILKHIENITEGEFEKVMEELAQLHEVKYWDYLKEMEINCHTSSIGDGQY